MNRRTYCLFTYWSEHPSQGNLCLCSSTGRAHLKDHSVITPTSKYKSIYVYILWIIAGYRNNVHMCITFYIFILCLTLCVYACVCVMCAWVQIPTERKSVVRIPEAGAVGCCDIWLLGTDHRSSAILLSSLNHLISPIPKLTIFTNLWGLCSTHHFQVFLEKW